MIDILVFMAPAIVLCLMLVGICGYVGIHVILREVIFIDIALAQISALGASFGLLLGLELASGWTLAISLGMTFMAAFVLSGSRRFDRTVPQEAFIGILYAVGSAATLLVGDRLAHGSEHVKELMCGHLLWTNWREVVWQFAVYAVLGAVYAAVHSRLLEQSRRKGSGDDGPTQARAARWDFIFYLLLGVLVTFAVRVAGVLLVFGFLVVPAVVGALLARSFASRLVIGWITGFAVSIAGTYLSYKMDFPTGSVIVVTLGTVLFLVALGKASAARLVRPRGR